MTRYLKTALLAAAALLASCIHNDIPYPVVELRIASVEGQGFSVSENNVTSRTVTLSLDEATDIRNVRIDAVGYDAVIHSIQLDKEEVLQQIRSSRELTRHVRPAFADLHHAFALPGLRMDDPRHTDHRAPFQRDGADRRPRRSRRKTASPGSSSPATPIWHISRSRNSNSAPPTSRPIRPRSKSCRAAASNRCVS